jgi:hypothetical protein
MKLTLEQTATRLGKSQRQVLYMIRQGSLRAEKIAGRWFIDSDDVQPLLNTNQQRSQEHKQRRLRAAVEEALELEPDEQRQQRYSIRDLKAFQITLPLYRTACQEFSSDHPAAQALRRVLEHLSRGCHRFDQEDKAVAYRAARDEASLAVCELALAESESADRLLYSLEQELMAALAGLLRRVDKQRR